MQRSQIIIVCVCMHFHIYNSHTQWYLICLILIHSLCPGITAYIKNVSCWNQILLHSSNKRGQIRGRKSYTWKRWRLPAMFSGRDSRLRRQIGDLVVDGKVIIKVEIGCKGAKRIYRVHVKDRWKDFWRK